MSAADNKAVFLSYASQDAVAVLRIAEALRAAGVEVWFDQNELVGGDAWDAKIRKQISECGLFVPVISAATQARGEGYFRLEWKLSVDRSHLMAHDQPFLLPVVIDATKDSEARVPLEFRAVQWTRLPAGETNTAFCARVKKLLSVPGATTESATSTPTPRNAPVPPAAASKSSRSWLVAVAPGAAALVVLALWQPWKKSAPASAAISTTTTAVANLPPSDARKLTLKARALIDDDLMAARENFRLAEELCQRAVTLAPDDGEAWATLARISCEVMTRNYETNARRRELARSQSERAAHLAPDSIETGLATAAYLDFTGELSAAETTLRQLLARAATDERVALAYVRALGRLNRLSDAENFRRTHPAFAGNSARVLAAQAYSLRTPGNFARAS